MRFNNDHSYNYNSWRIVNEIKNFILNLTTLTFEINVNIAFKKITDLVNFRFIHGKSPYQYLVNV